ncbi:MAG TPA: tetratricopeptide repeat protein [Methanoregulaceae archaeon]|nr:tetratricopeptide repeat protein [Methanoregulaceae archaeon]
MRSRVLTAVLACLVLATFVLPSSGEENASEEELDRVTDLMRMGRLDEALQVLQAFQATHPDHLRSWLVRGLILAYSDRFDEGLTEVRDRLAVDPRDVGALAYEVGLRVGHGEAGTARNISEQLVRLLPDSADAWDIHGGVLSLQDDAGIRTEAIAALDRAIAIDPHHVDALINRGEQAMPTDPAEAERYLRRAVDARPGSTDANEALTTLLVSQNRTAEALEVYDRWLRERPLSTLALTGKAVLLADQGRYEDALWLVENVLRNEPDHREALYLKGALLLDLRRPQEAVDVLNTLLELDPNDQEAEALRSEAALAVQATIQGTPANRTPQVSTTTQSPLPAGVGMVALLFALLLGSRR